MTANIRLWIPNRFDTNTDNATDVSFVVSSFVTMSPMPKQRLLRLKNRSTSIRSVLSWCSCFFQLQRPWITCRVLRRKALCRSSGSKPGFLSSGIFCLPVHIRGIVRSAPDIVYRFRQTAAFIIRLKRDFLNPPIALSMLTSIFDPNSTGALAFPWRWGIPTAGICWRCGPWPNEHGSYTCIPAVGTGGLAFRR